MNQKIHPTSNLDEYMMSGNENERLN